MEVMQIPVPTVPLVMGRGGSHVKKIEEIYSVTIRVGIARSADVGRFSATRT